MNRLFSTHRRQVMGQIILLMLICLGLVWLFIILGVFKSSNGPREIRFNVDSSGGYAIITVTHAGDLLQSGMVTTPWDDTITVTNGDQVYLTAGNPTQTGTLSCTIYVNNREWKKDVAGSPEDKVACAGIVP